MCEFCDNESNKYLLFDVYMATIEKHGVKTRAITSHNAETYFPVSFCFNCGDPLTEQKPLTLEQLRQMGGTPVWIESTREWLNFDEECRPFKTWDIIKTFDNHLDFSCMGLPMAIDNDNCMELVNFYYHKPKEASLRPTNNLR